MNKYIFTLLTSLDRYGDTRIPDKSGHAILVKDGSRERILPNYEKKVFNSKGHTWGYGGGGPHNTAFAVLYDVTKDIEISRNLYHAFCTDFISNIPYGYLDQELEDRKNKKKPPTITSKEIKHWIALKKIPLWIRKIISEKKPRRNNVSV